MNEISNVNNIKPHDGAIKIPDGDIMRVYRSFLSLHENRSIRTAQEYKSRVEEFFDIVLGKYMKYVTKCDVLKTVKRTHVIEYIDELAIRGNSFSTINTKLNSVRSFYNELMKNDIAVNPMIFKVNLDEDVTHHEAMSHEELEMLYEFMKNERHLADEKYLFAKILYTTANRRSETFAMTWKDSFGLRTDIDTGREVNVIRVRAKGGKWRESPVSGGFYEELQSLNKGQDKVFTMSPRTMERALDRFSNKIGKNITMHSFKSTAITHAYRATRDIEAVRTLANHEDYSTTQIYIKEEKSLVKQLSYHMSEDINSDILKELSHEDLLDLISRNKHIEQGLVISLSNERAH